MPRIQEYGEPDKADTPNMAFTSRQPGEGGSFGRDIAAAGEKFGGVLDRKYQRDVQEEHSNAQVDLANLNAESATELDQQIRSGNVDIYALKNNYQSRADKIKDKYQTREVQQFLNVETAQTGAHLAKNAIGASAVLKGKQAEDNWRTTLAVDSDSLYRKPTDFESVYKRNAASIDAQVDAGIINADQGRDLKFKTGQEFSKAAIMGYAKNSPGMARKALDTGMFNQWLDGETHGRMDEHIKRQQEMLDNKHERLMDLKEKNPWKFLHQVGETNSVRPLDLQGDTGQSFLNRANWVDAMEKKHGIKVPFMSDREADHISAQIMDANPSDTAQVFNDMSDKVQPKYLAKFGQQIFEKEPGLGIATMVAGDDPTTSKDIITGMGLLRKGEGGKAIAQPKQANVDAAFDAHIGQSIEDPVFRQNVKQASEALMVKSLFDNNKDIHEFPDSEMKKAVDKIVGPPVTIAGRKTLSFRGTDGKFLDEDKLGDLVNGLKDADVEKLQGDLPRTLSGESINLEKSRGRLQLKAVGDGKYWVFRDGMPALDKGGKKPFKLDLKLINAIKDTSAGGFQRIDKLPPRNMLEEI